MKTHPAIQRAWETGHFWSPENRDGWNVRQSDLPNLTPADEVVKVAFRSMSRTEAVRYSKYVFRIHERAPDFDGELGPAMAELASAGRCPVPDYAPRHDTQFQFSDPNLQQIVEGMRDRGVMEATGTGGWKGCHNVGDAHSAAVAVNQNGMPSFLKPLFTQVLKNVRAAYAGVGLLLHFVNAAFRDDLLTGKPFDGNAEVAFSFVGSSSGWIGLATVGNRQVCSRADWWMKFLSTYRGGTAEADIVRQWTTLVMHEMGHVTGLLHSTGGVMNPSIVNGLPGTWGPSDPSTRTLRGWYSGVPVAIPGDDPNPPEPPSTVEQQLKMIAIVNAVQDAKLQFVLDKIRAIEEKIG